MGLYGNFSIILVVFFFQSKLKLEQFIQILLKKKLWKPSVGAKTEQ